MRYICLPRLLRSDCAFMFCVRVKCTQHDLVSLHDFTDAFLTLSS